MQCTKEEIEAKRLQALEKLKKRTTTSPNVQQIKKQCTDPVITPQLIKIFYKTIEKIEVDLSLYDIYRFTADLSKYSKEITDIFRTVPSKLYVSSEQRWVFGLQHYTFLLTKLRNLNIAQIEEIPDFVLNCVKKTKNDINVDYSRLDPELDNALMPFQREAVEFGVERNGRCLLGDDMGLGKTFQALGIANYYKENWPLLISTTKSMKTKWEDTIHQYLPSIPYIKIQILNCSNEIVPEEIDIVITNHNLLSPAINQLKNKRFGVIIIDESHLLKKYKGKSSSAAQELCKIAKRCILLTGTPALSRPNELYTQLSFIDDRFFGNFFQFSKRYCDGKQGAFGWDSSGTSNLRELNIILRHKFMIRRLKDDILQQLPKKEQHVVELNVKNVDETCLTQLQHQYVNCKKDNQKQVILLQYFSETARIKINAVRLYFLKLLEQNIKFIIFAHHKIMLDALESVAKEKNKKYIRIDGQTSQIVRQKNVESFQNNDSYICAILSIKATNAGITLTAAKIVVFAELHWCPGILCQAESRAHRIGQNDTVKVYYLIGRGTADDHIWPMLQEKQLNLQKTGLTTGFLGNIQVEKQNKCDKKEQITNVTDRVLNDSLNEIFPINNEKENNENLQSDIFEDDGLDEVLSTIDI